MTTANGSAAKTINVAAPVKVDVPQCPGQAFSLTCPACGERTSIRLDVTDLDSCQCQACDAEFTVSTVRNLIADWLPFLGWLNAASAFIAAQPEE